MVNLMDNVSVELTDGVEDLVWVANLDCSLVAMSELGKVYTKVLQLASYLVAW